MHGFVQLLLDTPQLHFEFGPGGGRPPDLATAAPGLRAAGGCGPVACAASSVCRVRLLRSCSSSASECATSSCSTRASGTVLAQGQRVLVATRRAVRPAEPRRCASCSSSSAQFLFVAHAGRIHDGTAFGAGLLQLAGQLADLPPRLPVFLPQLLTAVKQGLLFGQRRRQPLQLHLRIGTGVVQLDLFHQLVDACDERLQFAFAGLVFFAANVQLAPRVHVSAACLRPIASRPAETCLRADSSRRRAPRHACRGSFDDASSCSTRRCASSRRVACRLQIGLQRQQLFQTGQVLSRRAASRASSAPPRRGNSASRLLAFLPGLAGSATSAAATGRRSAPTPRRPRAPWRSWPPPRPTAGQPQHGHRPAQHGGLRPDQPAHQQATPTTNGTPSQTNVPGDRTCSSSNSW